MGPVRQKVVNSIASDYDVDLKKQYAPLMDHRTELANYIRLGGFPVAHLHRSLQGPGVGQPLPAGSGSILTGSMKNYEEPLLSRPEFMRGHRSYIVNMLQVEELSSSHNGIATNEPSA